MKAICKKLLILVGGGALILTSCTQEPKAFSLCGSGLNLPDGTVVGLASAENGYAEFGSDTIQNGAFEIRATIERPELSMLTTNNLALVEKNGWPMDSVRWNYIDCFVSNTPMVLNPDLTVTGGQPQADYADYQKGYKEQPRGEWRFILDHPQSAVSAYLASQILLRGYHLTNEQLDTLEQTITCVPDDTARYEVFKQRLELYRKTVKGGPLLDLEIEDADGKLTTLKSVMPQGKYVLVDFWASWCGICLYSMPEVKALRMEHADSLEVVGISCDTDKAAWRKAMETHEMPWPQYILTKEGYDRFFKEYQVGNGVPYYLIVEPDGTVAKAPEHPEF